MMESYYMVIGDDTARYANGTIVDDKNIDLFVKKAEEELVSTTISWGINHKNELVDKMVHYGVSAIARNTYQYVYPYCDDENDFGFIIIHFNLVPCKEIRIVNKGITLMYPQLYDTNLNGAIEIDGTPIPFTVKNTGEFVKLFPNYQNCTGVTTVDYFAGYQAWLFQNSEDTIKRALSDYNAIQQDTELKACLESVYESMNVLKMKLSESQVPVEGAVQVWTEIVKNIQESYCEEPLNLGPSIKEDSELMVDKSATKNIKVPKEENKEPEEEPVKKTKEELLDEILKKALTSAGLPSELLDFCDGKKDAGEVHIVPISIERSKTPENWKDMSDSIKEHNKNQQQKNCHDVEVETSPITELLMELLGNHQKDVDD